MAPRRGSRPEAPLRLGVVGAGALGFHHLRIAGELERVDLAGFYEILPERAAEVSRALGVRAYGRYGALLDRIDALIVATPTRTHAAVAATAIARGIHAFIEKPIAATLGEADRILAAAADAGVTVQVGHVERFNTAVLGARPYLETPLFIESHRLARFTERGADVAVVLDLMIHDVDLVASLVGAPVEEIQATGIPVLTDSVDIANARIRFRGGAVANLTASRVSADRMRKLRIFQRSGYLSLDLAAGRGEFLRLKRELPALARTRRGSAAGRGAPGGPRGARRTYSPWCRAGRAAPPRARELPGRGSRRHASGCRRRGRKGCTRHGPRHRREDHDPCRSYAYAVTGRRSGSTSRRGTPRGRSPSS